MSYLPPVVCRRAHVLFTSSCLLEGPCLIYLQLFVGGLMSYLPPVVCRRAHVLFTSSCLLEGPCLISVIYVCLHIVVSNTYSVLSLCWFSSSCVTYVASFSRISILECPFGILLRLLKVANEIQNIKKKYFYNVPPAGWS
jgi:hypothetical protein